MWNFAYLQHHLIVAHLLACCRKSGWDIDCVVPVPDGSRPAAIQISAELGLPYREGLVKNRYVGRTFIMPDQRTRELSVRRKLNAMPAVFSGKSVLLVDDSIVRGTTMSQIVDMVRKAGAKKVLPHVMPCHVSCRALCCVFDLRHHSARLSDVPHWFQLNDAGMLSPELHLMLLLWSA